MLRFCDSCATYGTSNIGLKWTIPISGGFSVTSAAGRHGGPALVCTSSNRALTKAFDNQPSWYIGHAWKVSAIASGFRIIEVRDLTSVQVDVRTDASGHLQVTRNGTVLATSTQTVSANVFYFVELGVTIHPSAGSYTLRVNGVTWLTATGVNTRANANSYANTISFASLVAGVSATWTICDVVVCDGTGTTNNSLLGDVRVDPIFPNAAGDLTQWSPTGAASNYNCVNETDPNGDTTYVSSATAGNYDTYKFGSLPSTPVTIFGVQTSLVARKDDAGTRELAPTLRIGSTNYDGATVALGGTYDLLLEVRETNPATGVAWDPADLATGTFQAGVKVVS